MIMSNFNSYELGSLDIDVFCKINGCPVHVATMGATIPVAVRDRFYLRETRQSVLDLEYSSGFTINREGIERYFEKEYAGSPIFEQQLLGDDFSQLPSMDVLRDYPLWLRLFSWSFVEMARRGFYSFAYVERNNGENLYLLVAYPDRPYESNQIDMKMLQSEYFEINGNDANLKPIWRGVRKQN